MTTPTKRQECFAECRPCGARWLLLALPCGCPWCGELEEVFLRPTDGPSAEWQVTTRGRTRAMGVDCRLLLPWDHAATAWRADEGNGQWGVSGIWPYIGYSLDLPRDRRVWDALDACPSKPLPGVLRECSLVGEHDAEVAKDKYGDPLAIRRAADVGAVLRAHADGGNIMGVPGVWLAVTAFVEALPPDYPVILFWH